MFIRKLTPRIATSIWPPRIIANESLESRISRVSYRHQQKPIDISPKTDAPGRSVTVSLPALIKSLNMPSNTRQKKDYKNNPRIKFLLSRVRSHSKNTIFALQPHTNSCRQVLRYQRRHSNTQIDIESILDFLCCTLGDLVSKLLGFDFGRVEWFFWLCRGSIFCQSFKFDTFCNCGRNNSVDVYSRKMNCVG